jgi:glycine betaine/choline ABC-type transport system substrate-binding protein
VLEQEDGMRRARSAPAVALVLAAVVLLAGGCSSAAERSPPEDPRRPVITVASFDFPESETLAEIYGQTLRRHGYPVEVVPRLGPREIVEPALEQGRVDLVPECPERPLCLKGLRDVYGLEFQRFQPISSRSVTAHALEAGEIDVGMLETTNGNLVDRDLVQLEDDRRLQPAENIVPMARKEIIAAYGPSLVRLINAVTAQLTTRDVVDMNRRVELEGTEPAAVAADWLLRHPVNR